MFLDRSMALAGVSVVLALAGCGGSDDTSTAATESESLGFVGSVEGTDAFVSVVVADSDTGADEVVVCVCGGEAEVREGFDGPVDDPTGFVLTNDAGAVVSVELVDGVFRG